jgi:hypothetical protein
MILERGCAERGCACYDVRVDEGVEVKTVRELSDEEILKMAADKFHYSEYKLVIDFARAVLKKASEK